MDKPIINAMQKITPFLWFDDNLEEAINFYTSIFKNAKVHNMNHMPGGKILTATFELEGQKFMGLAGGPGHPHTDAVSFFINCETQDEIDHYWYKLTADGGKEIQCGWLKDKFGISWQVVPAAIMGKLMSDPDRTKAQRVMQAMMKMVKLDIAGLQAAYNGE